jgi:hypothetical protein
MLTAARRGVWRLRVTMDRRYPALNAAVIEAMGAVSRRRVGTVPRTGCFEFYGNWKHWICAFPQHGPGKKHTRAIRLEPWQQRVVAAAPKCLIAGLIHSDGCRVINRVRHYQYPRYFFSNYSEDLLRLFEKSCRAVGVETRRDGFRNVSIARRRSVAILDEFVGPKA